MRYHAQASGVHRAAGRGRRRNRTPAITIHQASSSGDASGSLSSMRQAILPVESGMCQETTAGLRAGQKCRAASSLIGPVPRAGELHDDTPLVLHSAVVQVDRVILITGAGQPQPSRQAAESTFPLPSGPSAQTPGGATCRVNSQQQVRLWTEVSLRELATCFRMRDFGSSADCNRMAKNNIMKTIITTTIYHHTMVASTQQGIGRILLPEALRCNAG